MERIDHEKRGILAGTCVGYLVLHLGLPFTMAATLMLWSSPGLGATLTWEANTEPDLAGYRVYKCNQQSCGRGFGTATLLVTLGKNTSFNIGTPATIQFYVITAYDLANNESSESNVATYTPPGYSPPLPPSPPSPDLQLVDPGGGGRPIYVPSGGGFSDYR